MTDRSVPLHAVVCTTHAVYFESNFNCFVVAFMRAVVISSVASGRFLVLVGTIFFAPLTFPLLMPVSTGTLAALGCPGNAVEHVAICSWLAEQEFDDISDLQGSGDLAVLDGARLSPHYLVFVFVLLHFRRPRAASWCTGFSFLKDTY